MMRCSDSFLQARLKAWRGANSRATDSSSPLSRRAVTRLRCWMATPEQLQVMISPSRVVPGATARMPLTGRVRVVMDCTPFSEHGLKEKRDRPGDRRTQGGIARALVKRVGGSGSDGQDTLEGGFTDGEGGHLMHFVADVRQVARGTLDDQGNQSSLGLPLPIQKLELNFSWNAAEGVGDEEHVRVADWAPEPAVVVGQFTHGNVEARSATDKGFDPVEQRHLVPAARRQAHQPLAAIAAVSNEAAPPALVAGDPRHGESEGLGRVGLVAYHAPRLVDAHQNRSLGDRLGRAVFTTLRLPLDEPPQRVILELGEGQLRQLVRQQPPNSPSMTTPT